MHSNDAPNGVKKLHAPFKPPLLSPCQMEGTNARSPGTKILKILRCVWMTLLGCKVPLSGQEPCFTIINTPYLTTGIGKILCNYKLEDHNNTFSLQQISGFLTFDRISRGDLRRISPFRLYVYDLCLHTCTYHHQEHSCPAPGQETQIGRSAEPRPGPAGRGETR